MSNPITAGTRVLYANAPYVVTAVNDGLLVLDGVAVVNGGEWGGSGRCRPRVTVLETDVQREGRG